MNSGKLIQMAVAGSAALCLSSSAFASNTVCDANGKRAARAYTDAKRNCPIPNAPATTLAWCDGVQQAFIQDVDSAPTAALLCAKRYPGDALLQTYCTDGALNFLNELVRYLPAP